MKRIRLRLPALLLAALLILPAMLSSCGKVPALEFENETYRNPKTGVVYLRAENAYEAAEVTDRKAAVIEWKMSGEVPLYEIAGVSPKEALADGDGHIYYAEGTALPTLSELEPAAVNVCRKSDNSFVLMTIDREADVEALVETYETGCAFYAEEIDPSLELNASYDVKFVPDGGWLVYSLEYRRYTGTVLIYVLMENPGEFVSPYGEMPYATEEDEDGVWAVFDFGRGLIFDRGTGLCHPAGEIVEKYLKGTVDKEI